MTHAESAYTNSCEDPSYPDQFPNFSYECKNSTPIVFVEENSVEILEHNDQGTISFTGGHSTYTLTIRGSGFFFDSNFSQTTLENVTSQTVTIFTNEEACGIGHISVSDGCSTAQYAVSSTDGRWGPSVSSWATGQDVAVEGLIGHQESWESGVSVWVGENAQYRQYETFGSTLGCGSTGSGCAPHCGDPELCPMAVVGTWARWPCYRKESVFANREWWTAAENGSSCSCSCISGHTYQEWICGD